MSGWGWVLLWVLLVLAACGYLAWRCWGVWTTFLALLQELGTLTAPPDRRSAPGRPARASIDRNEPRSVTPLPSRAADVH